MEKLKIGIVGCGGISNGAHFPAYINIKNVEVIGVCDIKVDRAEKWAQNYFEKTGKTPKVFENYADLFKLEGIEAVDICTPNYLHSIVAVAALEAGLHVLCEKPDAINTVEAQKMKDAAEKAGKTLMVIRNNRFMNISKFTKKYIEDGKMGEVYAARCGWQRRRGIPGKGGWFTTKEQSGGGPLIDLGVHMIDLTMWLMGNPKPVSVVGATYSYFNDSNLSDSEHSKFGEKKDDGTFDVEDLSTGFIRFDNGACMQLEFSWASNIDMESRFFELRGTKSGASWTTETDKLMFYTEDYGKTVDYDPNVDNTIGAPHELNIAHFVNVSLGLEEPIFTPEQGLNMVKILEAIYKSAETGREVIL